MPTAIIALKLTEKIPPLEGDFIGVDRGTLALINQHFPIKLAIGDFDSVDAGELKCIEKNAQETIHLNPIKDDTDSEAALNEALRRGYDRIILLGAMGARADHALINLRLVYQHPSSVILLDDQNRIQSFGAGVYQIKKENYTYISFFTDEEAEISLENFKYPLTHCRIGHRDLFTVSNEITGEQGTLTVHHGVVLMIQAKDKR